MNNFKGSLGEYKIIQTEDNSITIWSEFFDENCHNLSGAYEETVHNYIEGTHLKEQITNSEINVFDVGFGLGVGLEAFIDFLRNSPILPSTFVNYISIELDEDFCLWTLKERFPQILLKQKNNLLKGEFLIKNIDQQEIKLGIAIYIGDGRKTILEASTQNELPRFTSIFQDAFSPKKNPALWTTEWFELLKKNSNENVYMSTYSSATYVRKAMVEAGWHIFNSPGFGQKKTMTVANLKGPSDPRAMELVERSKALALRDENIE